MYLSTNYISKYLGSSSVWRFALEFYHAQATKKIVEQKLSDKNYGGQSPILTCDFDSNNMTQARICYEWKCKFGINFDLSE